MVFYYSNACWTYFKIILPDFVFGIYFLYSPIPTVVFEIYLNLFSIPWRKCQKLSTTGFQGSKHFALFLLVRMHSKCYHSPNYRLEFFTALFLFFDYFHFRPKHGFLFLFMFPFYCSCLRSSSIFSPIQWKSLAKVMRICGARPVNNWTNEWDFWRFSVWI